MFHQPTGTSVHIERVELKGTHVAGSQSDVWQSYAQCMRDYDEAMVRAWKEEVDTLLVFAGLFSAIVTAFNIEAYRLLQPDPSQTSIQLLQLISQQLAQSPNTGKTGTTGVPTAQNIFTPPTQSIRINACWFSSLICALFSALICIMVKQWMREYLSNPPSSPRHGVRFRQYRYDGLVAWGVPEIMAFLPILLELSLVLFLVGLVDFLFQLQCTVAAIATCLITMALLFYVATAIAPVFSAHCPYKSPQSWMLVGLRSKLASLARTVRLTAFSLASKGHHATHHSPLPRFANWSERDDTVVWDNRHDLDLEAVTWIQACMPDDNLQSSLASVIPDLQPDRAILLVFSILARRLHLSTPTLVNRIHERSCSAALRDVGMRFSERMRKQMCDMLLKLLECVPRDHDPAKLGTLDVLWTLWELCLGASLAEYQDPLLYQSVLNGVAELLSEGNPFRLRRAALNILYESTHTWAFLYCPAAIGNIIAFARSCYLHQTPDMFVKATGVALHLSTRLNWDADNDETRAYQRRQLRELLRDLSRFLKQCNEDGVKHEERSASTLVYGVALLSEKDGEFVGAMLTDVLLEGVNLGLIHLSHEEHLRLRGMQEKWPGRAGYHLVNDGEPRDNKGAGGRGTQEGRRSWREGEASKAVETAA